MTEAQWLNRVLTVAAALQGLSNFCPHCHAKHQVDCPLCSVVWHHGEALENYARLIRMSIIPEELPLAK
jgi:hypothetical protein